DQGGAGQATAGAKPSEIEAFWFWLKLGCISFGGPAAPIAIMHDELVERRRWISERRFLHALNFCMALPGPEAQQLASCIGDSMYGVRGAITAGGLFVAPSFVLLCGMSAIYVEYGEVTAIAGVVRGLGAAVIALVAAALIRIGGRVIHDAAGVVLAAAAFLLIVVEVPFPIVIAAAALVGYLVGRRGHPLLPDADPHVPGGGEPAHAAPPCRALRRPGGGGAGGRARAAGVRPAPPLPALARDLADPGRRAAVGRRLRRAAGRLLHARRSAHTLRAPSCCD